MRIALLLAVVGAAGAEAGAATVYRCGNAYADVPCPRATLIDADDQRTPAEQAAAREVASREKALAAQMEADRLQAEARPPPAVVRRTKAKTLAAPLPAPIPWTGRRRRRVQDNGQGVFVAVAPRVKPDSTKK